jgi:DNA-directed RNA polymerase specialized sigma24 family protein
MWAQQAEWHLPLEEASDATVIEASQADPAVFAKVFDRHTPVIFRYLARRAGSAADDLVANTFVAAFVNRDRYNPSYADARPWRYGIASKELARYFRQERETECASSNVGGGDDKSAGEWPEPRFGPSIMRVWSPVSSTGRQYTPIRREGMATL